MAIEYTLVFEDGEKLIVNHPGDRHPADLGSELAELAKDYINDDQVSWLYYYIALARAQPGVVIGCPNIRASLLFLKN